MLRRAVIHFDKLVIVESPNKVSKIEGILNNNTYFPDYLADRSDLKKALGPLLKKVTIPEKITVLPTVGHFMKIQDVAMAYYGQTPACKVVDFFDESDALSTFQEGAPLNHFMVQWTEENRNTTETLTRALKMMGKNLTEVILATDPDREGELIAVHALQAIRKKFSVPYSRAYIHSITPDGVVKAMRERQLNFCDTALADAAETRHTMDRAFGFLGSTVTRFHDPQMRSIGRVQTPALKLVHQREEKIQQFWANNKKSFGIEASCTFPAPRLPNDTASRVFTRPVTIQLQNKSKKEVNFAKLQSVTEALGRWQLPTNVTNFVVGSATVTPSIQYPPVPFNMATIITRANKVLKMSSEMVSVTLQELFQQGFITYPRTDSCRIDPGELEKIYGVVRLMYGDSMLYSLEQQAADRLNHEREEELEALAEAMRELERNGELSGSSDETAAGRGANKLAQRGKNSKQQKKLAVGGAAAGNVEDAHEAIRPTDVRLTSDQLATSTSCKALYKLIRDTTIAAFTVPKRSERVVTTITFECPRGAMEGASAAPLKFSMQLEARRLIDAGFSKVLAPTEEALEQNDTPAYDLTEKQPEVKESTANNSERKPEEFFASIEEFEAIQKLQETVAGIGAPTGARQHFQLNNLVAKENTISPPLPLTDGTLVEELKAHGVGRPSTYPTIVKTLVARGYLTVNAKNQCETTGLGKRLLRVAHAAFPPMLDIQFTANFEEKLDIITKKNARMTGKQALLALGLEAAGAPSSNFSSAKSTSASASEGAAPPATPSPAATGGVAPLPPLPPQHVLDRLKTVKSIAPSDVVLSQFMAAIQHCITESTRDQRGDIAAQVMKAQRQLQISRRNGVTSDIEVALVSKGAPEKRMPLPSEKEYEALQKAQVERTRNSVPDVARQTLSIQSLSGIQGCIERYLRANLPSTRVSH